MIEFENIIEIKKPVDVVFSFVSDFENVSKWNYYVLEVKKITEGPIKLGTEFHQIRKTDRQSFKIIEYVPGKKITIQTLPKSRPSFEIRFSFVQVKGGTKLMDEWILDMGKLRLIEKLMTRKIKKAVMENLQKMKKLLEIGNVRLQDGSLIQL